MNINDIKDIVENINEILIDEKIEENSKIQILQYENRDYIDEKNIYIEK